MSKFKVGDRVRRNYESNASHTFFIERLEEAGKCKNDIFIVAESRVCHLIIEGVRGKFWTSRYFDLVDDEEGLSADELLVHIKKHGITKVKTTENVVNVPSGTVLYMGKSCSELDSYRSSVGHKNDKFGYSFDVKWSLLWHDTYKGKFILVDSDDCTELISPKEKLIETDMDIEDIKNFPQAVLVKAEKQAKIEIAEEQEMVAVTKFKELLSQIADAERDVKKAEAKLKELRGKANIVKTKK